MKIDRPLGDRILVRLDPLKMVSRGGIELIQDNTENSVRTGTVVMIGPGRYGFNTMQRMPLGVEPGEKVCFLRWHLEHKTGKTITHQLSELGEELGLLDAKDILFAWSAHEKVEVSQ